MINRFSCFVSILWLAFSMQPAPASNPQNPLLTDESVYLSNQGIHKFNRNSLKPEWASLVGIETFEPVMGKSLIFAGSTQGLYALHPDSGEVVWHIEQLQTVFSPTVSDQLYAGSLQGDLYAIDAASGTINWRRQFDGWIYSPVFFSDLNQLWTGGQTHEAISLDSREGNILKRVALEQESIFSPQQLDSDHIVFNLFSGNSIVINAFSANPVAKLDGSSQPMHLSCNEDTIYRTNRDGSLIAFNKNNHKTVWQENIVEHNLSMHPVNNGYMLLSDLDHTMVLLDLEHQVEVFRKTIDGAWFSPIQVDDNHIVYFLKENLQPNQIRAVKFDARDT